MPSLRANLDAAYKKVWAARSEYEAAITRLLPEGTGIRYAHGSHSIPAVVLRVSRYGERLFVRGRISGKEYWISTGLVTRGD